MAFSFLGTIKEKSFDINFSDKPLIHSLPALKKDWQEYLRSIEAPTSLVEVISEGDTSFIVTGQQIGFLCSPLLTLYKVLTSEMLASKVTNSTDKKCIPIFWLQTEDHDLEEISTAHIAMEDRSINTISLQKTAKNRISVGDLTTSDHVNTVELEKLNLPHEIKKILLDSIEKEKLSESFAYLYYKLFPESKIILFDPRFLNISSYTKDIYRAAIEDQSTIHELLRQRYFDLKNEGIDPPIKVDKDRSIFFYREENFERFRLNFKDGGFHLDGKDFCVDYLLKDLEQNPNNFSSSALLRPLLQDFLFGPIAYIGGATELLYHLQISPLYQYFNISQPQLIERAQGVILETKSSTWWEKSFKLPMLFLSPISEVEQSLRKEHLNLNDQNIFKNAVYEKAKDIENLLQGKIAVEDKTLETPLNKTIRSINESLEKLINKYQESCLRLDKVNEERISRITNVSHPEGILQERALSAVSVITLLGENGYNIIKNSLNDLITENILFKTK